MINIINCLDKMVNSKINSFSISRKYREMNPDKRERQERLRTLEVYAKRLFVHLSLLTGARRGETVGLMWKDIDLIETTSVAFRGTTYHKVGVGSQFKNKPKNKSKLKVVYVTDKIVPLIKEYKALQKKVIQDQGWKDTGYVFLAFNDGRINKAGGLANGDTYTKWFSDFCVQYKDEIGLTDEEAEKAHVHMMRHSFVTYELMNGVDVNTVKETAGHKDLRMTARYGHVYDEKKMEAAKTFEKLYEVPCENPVTKDTQSYTKSQEDTQS
jgi:integrase